MSTVYDAKPQNQNLAEISSKLELQKQLQLVTNRIHATTNVDEIMLEVGQDVCHLLGADRLTIYALSDDRASNERFKVMERTLYLGNMNQSAAVEVTLVLWLWLG